MLTCYAVIPILATRRSHGVSGVSDIRESPASLLSVRLITLLLSVFHATHDASFMLLDEDLCHHSYLL